MIFHKNLATLIIILVVVFTAIGALYSYKIESEMTNAEGVKNTDSLIEFYSNVAIPSKRVVVTENLVNDFSSDSTVVVLGNDGSLVSVRGGAVLTGGNVINVEDESTSIYNIENPEKSVKTN